MKMLNKDIYAYAIGLNKAFDNDTQRLPIKVNFYFQKNKQTLTTMAADIEQARVEIIRNYGVLSEDGENYNVPEEFLSKALQELNDLLSLEQEINIYKINLNDFPEDLNFTSAQMEALMFMIEE